VRTTLAPPPLGPVEPAAVPSFSVAIALYNAAHLVADAVESALGQTVPPLEVIVCDDGSTDDVETALEPFAGRITLLRKENGGEASAKNAAARAAEAEFVVFLDADDVWLPERLEALGALAAERPDLDLLTTDAFLELDGVVVRRCYTDDFRFEVEDQRRAILTRNFFFGHVAARREVFLAAGGFDESILYTTDWDCWARLILDGARAGLVDVPLARYRLHPGSLSSQRARLIAGRLQTLGKALSHPSLSVEERRIAEASIALERTRLALAEARAALVGEIPGARRRSLGVALGRGHGARTRLKAVAAALAPRRAARRLSQRGRETTGGIVVPPPEEL
jgi:hypothetical protein